MAPAPAVSVVVPTRNGIDTLPALLEAIRAQRYDGRVEIVAVDSGSTDGTANVLANAADQVIRIAPEDFDHGLTRNLGVSRSSGALVVLTVQDAVPASDTWLAALVEPLRRHDEVAGAFARQVPRSDASGVARASLAGWVAAGTVPRTVRLRDAGELAAMVPMERLSHCAFDNVCSCIRRATWQDHPFRSTPIGEDIAWARDVLLAGHAIAFAPEAVVIHSHDRSLRYEYARTRDLHARLLDLFDIRTIPTLRDLARAVTVTAVTHAQWDRTPGRLPRALGLAVAWPLGQYIGGRRGARRRQRASGEPPCAS